MTSIHDLGFDLRIERADPVYRAQIVDSLTGQASQTLMLPLSESCTLNQDAALGNLLVGKLTGGATGIALPAKPEGELRLFFADKAMADLWIAVTWSSSK